MLQFGEIAHKRDSLLRLLVVIETAGLGKSYIRINRKTLPPPPNPSLSYNPGKTVSSQKRFVVR